MRIGQSPSVRFEPIVLFGLEGRDANRQLDRLSDLQGQVDKLQELEVFAPVIGLSLVLDVVADLIPIAHSGELFLARRASLPEIYQHWLTRL